MDEDTTVVTEAFEDEDPTQPIPVISMRDLVDSGPVPVAVEPERTRTITRTFGSRDGRLVLSVRGQTP